MQSIIQTTEIGSTMKILTFDLEDWVIYHRHNLGTEKQLEDILNNILELLNNRNITATFFCLGSLARKYPHIVTQVTSNGHQIGCHSDQHRWITDMTPKSFSEDTHQAIDSIEQIIGKKVITYRAPAFSITSTNPWAFDILYENGIIYDSSVFPASRDFGGFPSYKEQKPSTIYHNGVILKEFPIPIIHICGKAIAYSGGGYFRMIPYPLLKHWFAQNEYIMTYFHIRDFDNHQKRYWTKRYFKNYYGVNGAFPKFKQIIKSFDYQDIETAGAQVNWKDVPMIQI